MKNIYLQPAINKLVTLFIVLSAVLFFSVQGWGQNLNMQNGTFTLGTNISCGGFFYDSGGPGAGGSDNESFVVTICPPAGEYVQIVFNSVSYNQGGAPANQETFQYSLNGGTTWVTINSGTSPTVTGSSPGSCISFRYIENGSYTVNGTNWAATMNCLPYCPPSPGYSSSTVGYISNVNLNSGEVNNSTGWNAGLSAYPSLCANVMQGQQMNVSVSVVHSLVATAFYNYWIDWNNNGAYEPSELYAMGSGTASQTISQTIQVPCDAVVGSYRMRVVFQYFTNPTNPCVTSSTIYGETEEYCINVSAATVPVASAGPDQNLTCTSTATLDASASVPSTGFWSLVSGTGTITDPTNPGSTVTGISNGTSVFEWTAVGTCATDADQVSISTSGLPNTPVSAGDDIFTCVQNELLNGSDPAPFTGQWVVTAQPGGSPAVVFSPSATDPNASVSNLQNGAYTIEWQVATGAPCGTVSDEMIFTFGSLPAPLAGPDQTVCPTNATLDANDFVGATGTWSIVSQPGGSSAGFVNVNDPGTLIYGLIPGSYTLGWTVSGGGCGVGGTDQVVITVSAGCANAVTHDPTADQTLVGCDFTYTDDGGAGNYSGNVNQTWTTFCPDDPDAFATLTLSSGFMGPGDFMVIYDSDAPGAPIVGGLWYDSGNPSGPIANPSIGTTITSSTGCLYIQSSTTPTNHYAGWSAEIGCSPTAGIQNQDFVTVNQCGGGGGITLCNNGSIPAIADVTTNPPDLGNANSGCLGSQEGASNTWVYIVAESDGWIAFEISPAGGQDFDYAIWGPYDGGYACPGSTLDDPLRCSWAANGGAGCPADIGLGIVNTGGAPVAPGDVSEGGTCSPTNEGWTYPINATAGEVYVLLFQNYGFNNSSFGVQINNDPSLIPPGESFASLGCAPPTPLPIELLSFHGVHQNKMNQLFWTTASESQNAYFIIEKSANGQDWSELARVDGAGFSSDIRNYSTIDRTPLQNVTYYRLLQVDFDGKKRKYETISIVTTPPEGEVFGDLYPNPTAGEFYFQYSGKNFREPIELSIVNGMGQVMMKTTYEEFNNSQGLNVDASGLARGTYLVKIQQGDKVEVKRLSVM